MNTLRFILAACLTAPSLAFAAPPVTQPPAAAPAHHVNGILRFDQDIEIQPDDVVDGPVVVFHGSISAAGKVNGPIVAVGGSAIVRSGASVNGPVVALGGTSRAESGATVNGPLLELPGAGLPRWGALSALAGVAGGLWLLAKIIGSLGWIALAVLLSILFPRNLEKTRAALERRPGLSLVAGILAWPGLAVAGVSLLISIVGIAILPFLALAVVSAWAWGFAAISLYLGRQCLGRQSTNPHFAALLGAVLTRALFWVPILRHAACLGIALFGVGATMTSLFGWREPA